MSGVTMSAGVSSILLSLQRTAALTNTTQTRLATGKKVNSALDNPSSYFTALSLGARAGTLAARLDNIGQAQNTLKAANQGLASVTKLVQAAQSLAQQARQSPLQQTSYAAIDQVGSADISGEALGSVTGNVDTSGGFLGDVNGLQIQVGASTFTVNHPGMSNAAAIVSAINTTAGLGANGAVAAALDATGKYIKLTATSSDTSFTVLPSAAATTLGVASLSGTSTNLLQAVPGLSGTQFTVKGSGGVAKTITFGNTGAQVSTLEELQNALGGTNVSASSNGTNMALSVAASAGAQNSLTTSGTALAALGLPAGGVEYGAVVSTDPNPSRASYQAQYNILLQQIDSLTADSSYNGIDLLAGDNLTAAFNETGSSALTIAGVSLNAAGLGLTPLSGQDFQADPAIDVVTAALTAALASLRTQASNFGSSLATLQTRQDFTKSLINTLQAGSDGLTLADTNEEGASLLALQTRQDLSLTALALSANSDQAVLQLFG